MSTEKVIKVRRAPFVPGCLLVAAMILGMVVSPWWLHSIPFVAIGAIFTAPDLNCSTGCLLWDPKRQRLEPTEICAWNGVTVFVLEKPIAGQEGEGRRLSAGDLNVGVYSFAVPSDGRKITVTGFLIIN
jgi:hypothetical protein